MATNNNDEKYVLIRPPASTIDALCIAARKRGMTRAELIEKLLSIIVSENLIDAVLDDDDRPDLETSQPTIE